MKYLKHIATYLALSLILIQCTKENLNLRSNQLENIKVNQVIELKSIYYQNNIDNSKHLDSLDFAWSANGLLENKFSLNPYGKFGEQAYFTPTLSGAYDITLKVKHQWTGKILNTENFSFKAEEDSKPDINSISLSDKKDNAPTDSNMQSSSQIEEDTIRDELKVEEKTTPTPYSIQVSAWKTKDKALNEIELLKSLGYSPYIEKSNRWLRVRIGPYPTKLEARTEANKISNNLNRKPWVFPDKNKKSEDVLVEKNNVKTIEVENLIDYEIEVENLINYEQEVELKNKIIEVENLIDYEIEVENLINYEQEVELKNKIIKKDVYIQISTWRNKEDAQNELQKIQSLGYSPFILDVLDKNNQTWYKVRIGPLLEEESSLIQSNLSQTLNKRVRIVK